MKLTCGTLVLAIDGAGEPGALQELYAAHAAAAGTKAHAAIRVAVDAAAFVDGATRARELAGSVDPATGEFRLSSEWFLLAVPLAGDRSVRVTLPKWSVPVFDFVLQYLVQILAPLRAGAVVLHGSAIVRDGLGYAFVARSETGKTTVARISRELGYTVVAEEMTFVGWPSQDAGPHIYSLPVTEANDLRVAHPASAPLAAIYCLEQDTEDRSAAIPALRRTLSLAANTFIAVREPVFMDAALTVVGRLAAAVEPRTLHFTRSSSFWDTIDADRA